MRAGFAGKRRGGRGPEDAIAGYVDRRLRRRAVSPASALHVFAAVERLDLLEYPAGGSELATRLTETRLEVGPEGLVRALEGPGPGVRPDFDCVREYLQPVRTEIAGGVLYEAPGLCD